MAQLQFKGKTFVQNHHLLVKYHELVPVKAKSLTDKVTLHDNLIIHGDNLKGLKALLPLFARKIKCVCIDPPYNTGNEGWAYNDNVNSPMIQDWLDKVVDREDLTRHDKWLCMMMPRLKLIRELMTDDGVIFVFIDDNEVHHLRMLMDEVFGEQNFVTAIVWEKADSPRMDVEFFSSRHDSVLVFARHLESFAVNRELYDEDNLPKHYDKVDEDGRKYYLKPLRAMGGQGETREARPRLYYPLIAPNGKKVFPRLEGGRDGAWRWSKEKVEKEIQRIEWREGSDGWTPYFRIYADTSKGMPPETVLRHEEVGSSRTSRGELKDVFPSGETFSTPKPQALLKKLLGIGAAKDSIVLDSFAGSGTTAHAVLAQNAEDGGNRRFILIECEDYADTLTAERIRRVIKGVPTAKDETLKKGLGGSFSFFKLGKAIELESILDGDSLPTYDDLARYVFYTATGEEFAPAFAKATAGKRQCGGIHPNFIGESRNHQVFLFYEPDVAKLKNLALTLDMAKALPALKPARHSLGDGGKDKRRLVFAPTKYLDQEHLDQYRIDFAQLPFEIYELTR